MAAHYDEIPDTTRYYEPITGSGPGISYSRCGCVLPASCEDCDGSSAERREMWAMPRRDRIALELANRALDPRWRELHEARCSCVPCTEPQYGVPGIGHCAACCSGSGIEEYDPRCPVADHRGLASRQHGVLHGLDASGGAA